MATFDDLPPFIDADLSAFDPYLPPPGAFIVYDLRMLAARHDHDLRNRVAAVLNRLGGWLGADAILVGLTRDVDFPSEFTDVGRELMNDAGHRGAWLRHRPDVLTEGIPPHTSALFVVIDS